MFICILALMPLLASGKTLSPIDKSEDQEQLVVICPPFEKRNERVYLPSYVTNTIRYEAATDYCSCTLSALGGSKSIVIKCDFNFQKNILVDDNLFPFRKYKVSSAYVRMMNTKSANITSQFLYSWMDSPSSALDLWHCGNVTLGSTPRPHPLQLFPRYKSFVGVGIIDCIIDELPSKFLRDRDRGAIRIKDTNIRKINAGFLYNIDEIRYFNIDNSTIDEICSPISSSGVITLSKRRIHSWDGLEIANTNFKRIHAYAINITHKTEIEELTIRHCHFEIIEQGGIIINGNMNVKIVNNSFSKLDSLAIQVLVTSNLLFSNNIIEDMQPDSLHGLNCSNQRFSLDNNTMYIDKKTAEDYHPFRSECGTPYINFGVIENSLIADDETSYGVIVSITLFIFGLMVVGGAVILKKSSRFRQYLYKKIDTPLWNEDNTHDDER